MSETVTLRCYIRHVRAARICHQGSRAWCQANGVEWADFLTNGIPAQRLLDTGDPIVYRVVQEAIKESTDGQGQ